MTMSLGCQVHLGNKASECVVLRASLSGVLRRTLMNISKLIASKNKETSECEA